MITNWQKFSTELTRYLDLDEKVLEQIYRLSRPLDREDVTSHRHSGKPGAYKEKLLNSTVNVLNTIFAIALTRFDYER